MSQIELLLDAWGILAAVAFGAASLGFMVGVAMARPPKDREPPEFLGDQM